MGYKSDVRLVIKKETLKVFGELINKTNDKNFIEMMRIAKIKKTIGNVMYIGWNNLGANKVNLIENAVFEMREQGKSHRLIIIGENVEDISELYYDESKEDMMLPYPCLIRMVDDEDMENQLEEYANYINQNGEKEMNEYE